jgi:uncharacterized repeat protein (TIGR01451 family)
VSGLCGGTSTNLLYENTGTATGSGQVSGLSVSASYKSHYCNPPGSITVVKTPKNGTYNFGGQMSFSMLVTSVGPSPAQNVVLNDPLPTIGNLTSWTITGNPGGCTISSNTLSCAFGTLSAGQTRTVTVATNVAGGANAAACPGGNTVYNFVNVTSTGSNASDFGSTVCTPPGSYTLTKSPANGTYSIGGQASFSMVVTSTGPGTAQSVVLTDPLPTLGNLTSWIITSDPTGLCSISGNTLTCPFGNLANGQTRTVVVATNASGGANAAACPGGVPLNNTATVTGTGLAPMSANGSETCTPPPPGGFTLTKSPKGGTYSIGQNISFSMVVNSIGPGTAGNVVLNDPLPTLGNLSTWIISSDATGLCTIAANTLNCPYGSLASGQTRTVTVSTNASGGANATACPGGATLNNVATVSATGLGSKTDTGDYTCTPPPPTPHVTIKKYTNGVDANDPNAAGVPNLAPGAAVTWTYVVTNTGNTSVPRAQVSVTDNTTGVTPTFTSVVSGNGDTVFDPGEVWLYTATGTALDLTLTPPVGVTTMTNSCTAGGIQPPRTAYVNVGTATIPGATDSDASSYCNPPPPCNLSAGPLTVGTGPAAKNLTFTITNSGSTAATLSQITLGWPTANGALHQVLLGATVIYNGPDIAAPSATITSFTGTAAQRTINASSSAVITLIFKNNAATDTTTYSGTFNFGANCPVVLNANVCFLGYPYTSSVARTSTVFNESGVLQLVNSTSTTVQLYATDEHAPLLGVLTASMPVSAMPSDPGHVANPLVGDPTIADAFGRPILPSVYITDITGISDNASHTSAAYRAGDWQYGGTPVAPNDIFGAWKGAVVNGTTFTTDADPAKNGLNLGAGADTPVGTVTNLGYVAEVRWNVSALRLGGQPLQSGHTYRLQFIVHDGDQNNQGGDVGQACSLVKIQ